MPEFCFYGHAIFHGIFYYPASPFDILFKAFGRSIDHYGGEPIVDTSTYRIIVHCMVQMQYDRYSIVVRNSLDHSADAVFSDMLDASGTYLSDDRRLFPCRSPNDPLNILKSEEIKAANGIIASFGIF
ncbi:hypothetical protein SDC9_86365 [bioreactor metagenome]|uniref:Uncharacterized protein n=1 Tax=bioreactor metagenome TaxID=1076179 RepID=A0A644ZIS0_9ZZZZ